MSEQEAGYGDYPPTEVQRTWTTDDGGPVTSIQSVYDRYKHLDHLLSDWEWLGNGGLQDQILYELWQAVKAGAYAREQATMERSDLERWLLDKLQDKVAKAINRKGD